MKLASLIAGSAFLLCLLPPPASAGMVELSPGGAEVTVKVASLKELRFRSVMLQRYDFSCGSAALASLLTYHYKRPHTEEGVFQAMWRVGDQASIRKQGFSLLDMKSYLASIGLPSDGFRVDLKRVAELEVPGITLIESNGYKHFVIIKGVENGRVLIGDPARGLRAMPARDFEKVWTHIVLYIRSEIAVAQASFNAAKDWSTQPPAPIASGAFRNEDIGSLTLHIRPAGLF